MSKDALFRIGTAGWSIPTTASSAFLEVGTHLERYAQVFNTVEINSSFYRSHREATYARWAASVPNEFRFAVKVPKAITHERRMIDCEDLIDHFFAEVAGLGQKLGALLVQLPPSLPLTKSLEPALRLLKGRSDNIVALEPRNASWFTPTADAFLQELRISLVAADPAKFLGADSPAGSTGIAYFRLHGSPRTYWSAYASAELERWAAAARAVPSAETWVIFDNTASSAAIPNALQMRDIISSRA